jgi:hypothetical protein
MGTVFDHGLVSPKTQGKFRLPNCADLGGIDKPEFGFILCVGVKLNTEDETGFEFFYLLPGTQWVEREAG